jgi:hypothetical protein
MLPQHSPPHISGRGVKIGKVVGGVFGGGRGSNFWENGRGVIGGGRGVIGGGRGSKFEEMVGGSSRVVWEGSSTVVGGGQNLEKW